MTSYCPQTRFTWSPPDKWHGSKRHRFATREEAEASLEHIRIERSDLLETRVIELLHKPTRAWVYGTCVPYKNNLGKGKLAGYSMK